MLLYCSQQKTQMPQLLTSASIGGDVVQEERNRRVDLTRETHQRLIAANQNNREESAPKQAAKSDDINKSHHGGRRRRHHHHNHHVRFHSVELQEYAVTLGDHPFCTGYFPLTLDWSHTRSVSTPINAYEASKLRRRDEKHAGTVILEASSSIWDYHLDAHERLERLRLVAGLDEPTLVHLELCRRQAREQAAGRQQHAAAQ